MESPDIVPGERTSEDYQLAAVPRSPRRLWPVRARGVPRRVGASR